MDTKKVNTAVTICMTLWKMRKKLYAESPFDLATKLDDAYRDGVDATIVLIEKSL